MKHTERMLPRMKEKKIEITSVAGTGVKQGAVLGTVGYPQPI